MQVSVVADTSSQAAGSSLPDADESHEAEPLSPSGSHRARQPSALAVGEPGTAQPPAGRWARFKGRCGVAWRRIKAEFWAEWPLTKPRLLVIVLCLIFQYVHAIFTLLAYHLHKPLPEPLHDIGFEIFPELGESNSAVSEAFVYTGFGMFAAWLLSPFVTRRKSFHSVVVFKRVLVIIVTCQILRIITFLSTQIPAPNYHCRAGEPTATQDWPTHWWQNIIVNVSQQSSKSCGDLIFSSHITFLLVFMWTYAVMGQYIVLKVWWFIYTTTTTFLIIASRKHYTVDMVVAWYVVPAFFFHFKRHWTTLRNDIASSDGMSIARADALPSTRPGGGSGGSNNGKTRPASPLGGLGAFVSKLGLSPWGKGEPPAAERVASQHLLGAQGPAGSAAMGAEGGTDLERGPQGGSAASEEGLSEPIQARGDSSSNGNGGRIPASPTKRPSRSSSSSAAAADEPGNTSEGSGGMLGGMLAGARALPARVAQMRGGGGGHQRTDSADDSSTVALWAGAGPSSSTGGGDGAV